ncbi:MAG: hypothetical protein ACJAQT_004238 [Akkermansiaceae bacterium]|jgi:hypothetical protein
MTPDKICSTCGRSIQWRKKWENCWDEIKYCSSRCRTEKPSITDQKLEEVILQLLNQRARGASICPSEATRAHYAEDQWRNHLEQTRQAARRLAAKGKIEILQQGKAVDPSTAKGPIRLRKKRPGFT